MTKIPFAFLAVLLSCVGEPTAPAVFPPDTSLEFPISGAVRSRYCGVIWCVAPSDDGTIVRVSESGVRVLLPRTEGREERRDGRGSPAPTERRWITTDAPGERRILQSAPNRRMLLPIPDSLRPSPR